MRKLVPKVGQSTRTLVRTWEIMYKKLKRHTCFFGGSSEGSFNGSAVGVVASAHTALIFLLVRANLFIAAHFLTDRKNNRIQISHYSDHDDPFTEAPQVQRMTQWLISYEY